MLKKIFLPMILGLVSIFLLFTVGSTSVKADTLNYTVGADLPDNQIEKSGSYFNLKVTPGQSQDLTIKITNKDTTSHQYEVSINRGLTNQNGIIDYGTHGSEEKDGLEYNIESLVDDPQNVTVDGNSTKLVTLHLNAPKQAFSGIILGGIRVKELTSTSKNSSKKGLTINNQYAYVIGLELRQNSDKIKPKLQLGDISEKQYNYYNYVSANLINPTPSIIDNLSINATVKNTKGKNVYTQNKTNLSMAPNSDFGYLIGSPKQTLKAGNYELVMDAKSGSTIWHFDRKFTITTATAKKLEKTTVAPKSSGPNYLLIAFIIAILLIMILVIFVYHKKYRKN
ncbi:DUF916 and DUF3324 domain-containing protein [Companilactobacillus allii]|uniref:Uncharacterized protein n=1 Tax=Companilactobacillus allii TaxID=1847728 RepID=A0A1P8Q5Q8_9LACO|nr:DUF916 and DUF3324 domain-containing protein [Companilactobacillus allii]APX73189.1 hypothetical protein BTM29_11790 [Companilactobacillus allii]USQ67997.1 DUF916 and DUF3324 domain-containing protein [Companilactobacillus allii]